MPRRATKNKNPSILQKVLEEKKGEVMLLVIVRLDSISVNMRSNVALMAPPRSVPLHDAGMQNPLRESNIKDDYK